MYAYTPSRSDELQINPSDVITVIYEDNENWWFGELPDGRQGYFPANYVMVSDGKVLMFDFISVESCLFGDSAMEFCGPASSECSMPILHIGVLQLKSVFQCSRYHGLFLDEKSILQNGKIFSMNKVKILLRET